VPALAKVLIANRGEIAVRIARACQDAGLTAVAVYAPEDRDAMHVRVADEAYALPGETLATTYLDATAIVGLAQRAGADTVHPGYGFLAESATFARLVSQAGLTWVGPSPAVLERLGDKVAARQLAASVGAPLVPASPLVADVAEVAAFIEQYGLPVVIKAAHGGGGRGMRVVREAGQVEQALEAAQREALAAFGRDECFVERYVERPRHIETQCLADAQGGVAVVSTRDCSVQRRHQKLIEEAPAPFLTDAQVAVVTDTSRAILRAVGYQGAATCEFLLAPDGAVYFMEVNPRLQVEHPVSEEVSGIDLVREQLRLAAGEALGCEQVPALGHAIEFRINAEDPGAGFLPSPGRVAALRLPGGPGIRLDFGHEVGDTLTGTYDSLLGKVIVWGATRHEALARARRALAETKVTGLATVVPFHRAVLAAEAFTAAGAAGFTVHTGWVEGEFAATVAGLKPAGGSLEGAPTGGPTPPTARMVVEVDGKRLEVVLPAALAAPVSLAAAPPTPRRVRPPAAQATVPAAGAAPVTAPMQGTVVRVAVSEGDTVEAGQLLVVVEAMKMEQPLAAPRAGTVRALAAAVGQRVPTGHVLCVVD
jgi:acetyl-CoA/propionyl-CoA carboxylase biotin carboxyl carrier protein